MMKYAVVSLILLLNGVYGVENGGSKVADSTTTSTTIDPVIELILSPLLQKEGETICKEDVKRCLLPLTNYIKSQKQLLYDLKEREKVQLVATVNDIKDREISLLKEDLKRLTDVEEVAKDALSLAAYYSCAIEYRTQIECAINQVIQNPQEVNIQERIKIHNNIQEERSLRKKNLGEVISRLGLCAKEYIRLSENDLGKDSIPPPSKPEPPSKVESSKKKNNAKMSDTLLEDKPMSDIYAKKSMPAAVTQISTKMTSIESTTKVNPTTIHFETIDSIKEEFEYQIKRLLEMKIVDSKDLTDVSFLSIELNWLSEQHEYSDEIWKRWEDKVRLWDNYYRYIWRTNAKSAPELSRFSSSLRRCLFDERNGLLNKWEVFDEGARNYAAAYDNQTLKAPFSDLQMKCQWILYTEKDTFLHKAVERLLVRMSIEKNKINLHSLYYTVCHRTSKIFNSLSSTLLHTIPVNLNLHDCPLESPAFNRFLVKIANGDDYMKELSLILKDIFLFKKESDVPADHKLES